MGNDCNSNCKVGLTIRSVLVLVALALTTFYGFVHFDQENERNTFSEKRVITDYEIHHLRGGTLFINFSCENNDYYFVDCDGAIPNSFQQSFSQKKSFYSETFEQLIKEHSQVQLISTNEKEPLHAYGHGRVHVVEIKHEDETLLSIEGHNKNQRFKQKVLFVIVVIGLFFFAINIWIHCLLTTPTKSANKKRSN